MTGKKVSVLNKWASFVKGRGYKSQNISKLHTHIYDVYDCWKVINGMGFETVAIKSLEFPGKSVYFQGQRLKLSGF